MNIYYNNSFEGFYPVGTSAVVVAESKSDAALKLFILLELNGLSQDVKESDMKLIDSSVESAIILNNGDY